MTFNTCVLILKSVIIFSGPLLLYMRMRKYEKIKMFRLGNNMDLAAYGVTMWREENKQTNKK